MTIKRHPGERGGVAILAIVGILAMCALGALSVDIGTAYHERRQVRTLAQSAIIAATQEAYRTGDALRFEAVAKRYAERMGYRNECLYPASASECKPCKMTDGVPNCVSVAATEVDPIPGKLPDGGYRITVKRLVMTTASGVLKLLGVDPRNVVEVRGQATAHAMKVPLAAAILHKSRNRSLSVIKKARVRLTDAALVHVNSDAANAINVDGGGQLDTYTKAKVRGTVKVSANSKFGASGVKKDEDGDDVAESGGPCKLAECNAGCMWDPFSKDNPYCPCGSGNCTPTTAPSGLRSVPEIKPGGQFDDPALEFTVQCGSNAGPHDNKTLLLFDGPGYPRQNKATLESDPTDDSGYSMDPTRWKLEKHFQYYDGLQPCPGLGYAQAGQVVDLTASPNPLKPDGEYVLCPGIYMAGISVRNERVRLATCDHPACAGKCPGAEKDNPVFIMAAGGLKVRTSRNGAPDSPPYATGELSRTYVKGEGVTLIQTKHTSGGYARIYVDKHSDLRLTPPPMTSASVFKGISIYVDRDFKKALQISGRGLAGPFGGIAGDIYAPNATVVVRGATKNVKEMETGIHASFIAASLRFGGAIDDCDPEDECGLTCSEECALLDDATAQAECETHCVAEAVDDENDDPMGVFDPQNGGAYAHRIVLAPID